MVTWRYITTISTIQRHHLFDNPKIKGSIKTSWHYVHNLRHTNSELHQNKCTHLIQKPKTKTKGDAYLDFHRDLTTSGLQTKIWAPTDPLLLPVACPLSTTHLSGVSIDLVVLKTESIQACDYVGKEEKQHWNEVWNTSCISNMPKLLTYVRFDLLR